MSKLESITNSEIRHDSRLKNFLRKTVLYGSMFLGAAFVSQEAIAQYNVTIHARSLDKTTEGSAIVGAVISKDGGDVVKLTGASGDATLTNVGGPMNIKISHQDYLTFNQTFNITSDTTLWLATPARYRSGTFGNNVETIAEYWKAIYVTAGAPHDGTKWKQIIPVNVRIEGASVADSLNIVAAMNTMKNSAGWDLFKIVNPTASKDTTYTIYMNSSPNISEISPDINWIAVSGYSKIGYSTPSLITHEIVQSQDGWATSAIPVPTNADPMLQTRPPWQPLDGSYLSLKLEQDFRKKGGKQSLMIGLMQNYVALGNVGIVPVVYPASNAVDLDTLLNIIGTKDINTTTGYDFKITSDILGNNIVISQNGVDRPRINVDLEPGKDYYIFERANGTNIGLWSNGNKITTKTKPIITLPGQAFIGSPLNNATKVGTPVPYSVTAPNATSYRILAARDLAFLQMLKDTIVNVTNPTIPLPNGILIYTKAIGINANGSGPESNVKVYTTIKATPSLISILFPLNNAVEVTQPIGFISTSGTNAEGYGFEIQTIDNVAVLDTALSTNGFSYGKLNGNREFKIRCWGKNSDVDGPKSAWRYFITFNNAPVVDAKAMTDSVDTKKDVVFEWTASDKDKDALTFSERIWNNKQDTTIYNITEQSYTLEKGFLKPGQIYNYTITADDETKQTTSSTKTFNTKLITGIDDIEVLKGNMIIYPNPAPSSSPMSAKFHQDIEGIADVDTYNSLGVLIRHVYNERQPPGDYLISIDNNGLATGMYLIKKTIKGTNRTQIEVEKAIIK